MSSEFEGRVALVTGGGKGVGGAVSQLLAARGAHVIVNCFHSQEAAETTVTEIRASGGSAEVIRASVAQERAVAEMFETIAARHGRLDVLVNNASRGVGSFPTLNDDDWDRAMAVIFHGSRRCSSHAARLMAGRGGGAIVNVSAAGSSWVLENYAAAGTAKAAMESLTRYLAVEFAPQGIRVNSASTSVIESDTVQRHLGGASLGDVVAQATPLGRLAREEEFAELIAYLASDRSSYITGQTILADGGLTLASAAMSPRGRVRPLETPATPPAPELPTAALAVEASAVEPAIEVPASPPADESPFTGDTSGLVAIVGTGMVVPGASGPDEFWQRLQTAPEAFSEPSGRWPLEHFWSQDRTAEDRTYSRVAGFVHDFRPHPALVGQAITDEAAQWLRHTLLQSREGVTSRPGDRCGVYVGAWPGGSQALAERIIVETLTQQADLPDAEREELRALLLRHYLRAREDQVLPHQMVQRATDGIVEPVVETVVVDTACSSSLYTADFGVKALLAGECEIAYCGGVEVLDPTGCVLFAKLNGLSPTGRVHSLDGRANGTLFSDGAGMVALKLLSRALADNDEILGVISGFGGAADGRGKSISAPNPEGQMRAIRRAREVNSTAAEEISWVLAHATGTPAGDRSEVEALGTLAPEQGYICTSNKAVIGHTGWAAGAASLIHAVQALKRQRILAQTEFTGPPEGAEPGRVVIPSADQDFPRSSTRARTVGVSAFGFGGTNAHLLLTDRPTKEDQRSAPRVHDEETVLVAWSAHLPGGPDHDQVTQWLRGLAPAPDRGFGDLYPCPSPAEVRLLPRTMRSIDRCQMMAVEVTNRFLARHGELWAGVHDTTGVFAAHTGVPRCLAEMTLRCQADQLTDLLTGAEPAISQSVRDVLTELCERVPESNEDSQPGVMTNVIASRIAARFDLHGTTMTIDAGEDSTSAALKAAERYLHTGELDLALVLALNGNSTGTLAALTGAEPGSLAEGAFLLAVSTARQARERGWPVLSRLRLSTPAAPAPRQPTPDEGNYLGAQGAITILRAAETGRGTQVSPVHLAASTVHVLPEPDRTPLTERYEQRLVPAPALSVTREPPRGGVLLTDTNRYATRFLKQGATVLTTDPENAPPGVHVVTDPQNAEALEHTLALLDEAATTVTVISEYSAPDDTWPQPPPPNRRHLHDLLLLAVQRLWPRWTSRSSLAVLLTGQTRALQPHPHAALFTGFVKSLAWEHPDSAIFALLTDKTSSRALEQLESERRAPRAMPIVWDLQGERHLETLEPMPLDTPPAPLPITDDSVVLVTGGTGGLATAILEALSRTTRPDVWLMGRTDLAELAPYQDVLGDPGRPVTGRELVQLVRQREDLPLRSVIAKANRLSRAREVQTACESLRKHLGPDRVHYVSCDLRDSSAVEQTVAAVRAASGDVDVVIHAAGVFKPALMESTDLAGFQAVRDTKLASYHHLKQALAGHPPALWCNVGSAAGIYGITGDTAYAAANDFLAAASRRSAAQGTRELTIAFPLWAESGFGSSETNRGYLEAQGILTPITDEEGTQIFLSELTGAAAGSVGTYLGPRERGAFAVGRPGYVRKPRPAGYLHGSAERTQDRHSWELTFDPVQDAHLEHHLVDGKATVPGTLMLEIAAEAAERVCPHLVTHGFREALFEAFIKPFAGRRPLALTVTAVQMPDHPSKEGTVAVDVTIESDGPALDSRVPPTRRRHFRTRVLLGPDRRAGTTLPGPRAGTGRTVPDPYYQEDSPVWLRGIFFNTADSRAGNTGEAWSNWAPSLDGADMLAARRTPFLMLCAALRTVALSPDAAGKQSVYVPRALDRIDLYAPGANDLELTQHYGDGIQLHTSGDKDFRAYAPDGSLLLEVTGVTMATMGTVSADAPAKPLAAAP
ncbi:SDR family oxidoreductase [Streptomyces parvus]|uniref:SDR family oxidoreductase n=1 Tax=Streptomyces parvus TaxID=66428 RepID=UPI0037135E94